MHWLTYLCAWADIREHYERAQPDTYEAVMSMTLFDNSEFRFRGRPLSSTQWKPVITGGILTVADIWSVQDGCVRDAATTGPTCTQTE